MRHIRFCLLVWPRAGTCISAGLHCVGQELGPWHGVVCNQFIASHLIDDPCLLALTLGSMRMIVIQMFGVFRLFNDERFSSEPLRAV